MRLMRTTLFSLSGKFNLELTATPTTDITSKGGVLEPSVFDPSLNALGRMSPLFLSSCQCLQGPLWSAHCIRAWFDQPQGHVPAASALSPGASSPFPECCQALPTPLEGLHCVPVYGIRHFINKHTGNREPWQVKVLGLLLIMYWIQKWIWSDIQRSCNYQ